MSDFDHRIGDEDPFQGSTFVECTGIDADGTFRQNNFFCGTAHKCIGADGSNTIRQSDLFRIVIILEENTVLNNEACLRFETGTLKKGFTLQFCLWRNLDLGKRGTSMEGGFADFYKAIRKQNIRKLRTALKGPAFNPCGSGGQLDTFEAFTFSQNGI